MFPRAFIPVPSWRDIIDIVLRILSVPEVRVDGIVEKTPRLENAGPACSREFSPSEPAFYGKKTELIVIIFSKKK